MVSRDAILRDALTLSESDRLFLALALLDSTEKQEADISEAQMKEIMRRRDELLANPDIGIPWERLQSELSAKYGRTREEF